MYPSQNLTLMTDLYQLTMMQGYYTYHKTSQRVVFDLFYRENPFHGAFAIAAGLEQAIDYIRHLSFSREDIEYLRKLLDENGRKVLERLLDNGSEIERFQIKESFKDGFHLGMQLTAAGLHNQKQL